MNINKKIISINKAFWYYCLVNFNKDSFSDYVIEKLTTFLDFDYIPHSAFVKNEKLLQVAHRSNMTSSRLIGLIHAHPIVINHIELNNFKFEKEELIGLLVVHPELFDYFEVDFNDFSLMQLVRIYSKNINLNTKVDFSKFNPSIEEIRIIINNYIKDKHVVELLDFNTLNNNQIRRILSEHGEYFVDKLNLNKLKPLDWIDILNKRRELFKYCDLKSFIKADGYELARLVIMFEDLEYLIKENKSILGAMAVETLLLHDPQKYLSMVDTSKLKDKNWMVITKKHNYLKPRYIFDVNA